MSTTPEESVNSSLTTSSSKTVPLLRNRDYLLLWSGQAISTFGTSMSTLAFPLLILAITGSPALVGFAGALGILPFFFLGLPVGALIDRWDRKKVMIICDVIRALNMGSVPLAFMFGQPTLVQLYLNSLIEGTCFVFFNIAQAAALPQVVPSDQLPSAIGQNEATNGFSTLFGPLCAGVIYSIKPLLPFLCDALSYVISVISLIFIRVKFQQERQTEEAGGLLASITEGLSWLWNQPVVRFMAFLTGSINFMFAGLNLVIIVLAQRQHASATTIGLIFTLGGIGSIVGSLIGGPLQKRFNFGLVIIGSIWFIALLWPLYTLAPNIWLLGLISALLFLTIPIYNVMQFSYRLALIPDHLQGRVNSVFRLIAFGFQPLGVAVIGTLIQAIGVISLIVILSIYLLILALITALNANIRNARSSAEPYAESR